MWLLLGRRLAIGSKSLQERALKIVNDFSQLTIAPLPCAIDVGRGQPHNFGGNPFRDDVLNVSDPAGDHLLIV